MKKAGIVVLLSVVFLFTVLQQNEAKSRDFYRTFEIIAIGENSLTLRDSDNNVIEVAKDPGDYKVGYKVRYDSVRNRLRDYRWQDYKVIAVNGNSITLQHETGDTLTVKGNYAGKYNIGDLVGYEAVDGKQQ